VAKTSPGGPSSAPHLLGWASISFVTFLEQHLRVVCLLTSILAVCSMTCRYWRMVNADQVASFAQPLIVDGSLNFMTLAIVERLGASEVHLVRCLVFMSSADIYGVCGISLYQWSSTLSSIISILLIQKLSDISGP
jgi:hypothetical protein